MAIICQFDHCVSSLVSLLFLEKKPITSRLISFLYVEEVFCAKLAAEQPAAHSVGAVFTEHLVADDTFTQLRFIIGLVTVAALSH